MTKEAGRRPRGQAPDADRSKNFFALGSMSWMYTRPEAPTLEWIASKFPASEQVIAANTAAFKAGYAFGETAELFDHPYEVKPADHAPGTYPNITGNTALAWGLVAAGQLAKLPVFLGAYPITPATDILHELSKHKNFGVRTIQAEDEIAAHRQRHRRRLRRAPRGDHHQRPRHRPQGRGHGPGRQPELPADHHRRPARRPEHRACRPRPSRPTCCRRCTAATASRPCRSSPRPARPHCFDIAIEAVRLAVKYRTPVILLSDGYLANGAEPWLLPDVGRPARHQRAVRHGAQRHRRRRQPGLPALPARRRLARPWAIPGTPGLEHRIGGLEKEDVTGNVSYDPANHEQMVRLRAEQDRRHRQRHPAARGRRPRRRRAAGRSAGAPPAAPSTAPCCAGAGRGPQGRPAHLRHLNPFPRNLGEVLKRYPKVLVPEMNLGQLSLLLRGRVPGRRQSRSPRCKGLPFTVGEIERAILEELGAATNERHRRPPSPTKADWSSRPGSALVPGLRRLLDPDAVQMLHARARRAPREHGVRLRHRLRRPLPVLHEHLRHAHHPRPGARRWPPAWPWPGPTSTSGSSPATATACRSAATT